MQRNDQSRSARPEIPPGTLHLLILQTLRRKPLHGYAIAKQIQTDSNHLLQVEEGSLYPALQRILRQGWATAEWVPAGPKRRARVYQITPAGRRQLETEAGELTRVLQIILRMIQPA